MRQITSWFILTAPFLILLADWLVYQKWGSDSTITGVVRDWTEDSWLPEAVFLAGCMLMWLHLFRGWPEGSE